MKGKGLHRTVQSNQHSLYHLYMNYKYKVFELIDSLGFKRQNISSPLIYFLITGIILITVLYYFSQGYYHDNESENFLKSILSEAHGMLFDIIMFGVILTIINKRKNKELAISRYYEEIEDYRGLEEPIASHRTSGLIRRLLKSGATKLLLHKVNLENASLMNINLKGANLMRANLNMANLKEANLCKANLTKACLSGTHLEHVNLSEANLREANLSGANMRNANLKEAFLEGANLEGSNLECSNLLDAQIKLYQLKDVKSLDNAIMPDGNLYNKEWSTRIRKSKPTD